MSEGVSVIICLATFLVNFNVDGIPITYNAALNRPAYQSSEYSDGDHSYPASLANDGRRQTRSPHCSISERQTNPWWAVDLGGPTTVSRVDLTNTAEPCCGHSADNFIVGLANDDPSTSMGMPEYDLMNTTTSAASDDGSFSTPTLWNYTLCGQYPGAVPAGAKVSVFCPYNLPPFRYVIVQFPIKDDQMYVCEVEVFAIVADQVLRDVALNKSSFQSSNRSSSYTYMAKNGNDGSLSSCMETGYEVNPWWAVDLGVPTVVHQVTINNASVYDSSSGYSRVSYTDLANFIIGLSNADPRNSSPMLWKNYVLCAKYPRTVPSTATVTVYCARDLPPSRYVIVQFSTAARMKFCEVKVFTLVTNPIFHNVALNKSVYQISTDTDHYGQHAASLANDGLLQADYEVFTAGCAGSQTETNPWWVLDLEVSKVVCLVKLTNRRDRKGYRSNNFIVGLTNDSSVASAPVLWNYTVCGQYPGGVPDGATVSLQCTNVCERALRFRYVIVQFPLINDQMNFCEIEVFALDDGITMGKSTVDDTVTGYLEECDCEHYRSATIAFVVLICIFVIIILILLILLFTEQVGKVLTTVRQSTLCTACCECTTLCRHPPSPKPLPPPPHHAAADVAVGDGDGGQVNQTCAEAQDSRAEPEMAIGDEAYSDGEGSITYVVEDDDEKNNNGDDDDPAEQADKEENSPDADPAQEHDEQEYEDTEQKTDVQPDEDGELYQDVLSSSTC